MRYEDQRRLMVNELRMAGIANESVLAAFSSVPRELYVLPQYREYAYRNQPLPIHLSQTISQPLMIAIMMDHLDPKPEDIVLEVGTGSGYQAALLAEIVKEVCSIERLEPLSLHAQKILKSQGYNNIYFRIGDGAKGWQKAYPPYKKFDKIIVTAAAADIPAKLVDQLAEGGIMVVPAGYGAYQILTKIVRKDGEIMTTTHGGCAFVPLVTDE